MNKNQANKYLEKHAPLVGTFAMKALDEFERRRNFYKLLNGDENKVFLIIHEEDIKSKKVIAFLSVPKEKGFDAYRFMINECKRRCLNAVFHSVNEWPYALTSLPTHWKFDSSDAEDLTFKFEKS